MEWVEGDDGVRFDPDHGQWQLDPDADWEVSTPWSTARSSGKRVRIGDRFVPLWFEHTVRPDGGRAGHRVRFEVRDGAVEVVSVEFFAAERGQGIVQRDLDSLRLSEYWSYLGGLSGDEATVTGEERARKGKEFRDKAAAPVQRNRRITPELLKEVAEVYRNNVDGSPRQEVSRSFFVSLSQASNYIRLARDAGFLPPTDPGRKKA